MKKTYATLLLVLHICQVLSQVLSAVHNKYVDETFTTVCGDDASAFSNMNRTVSVRSAIQCARYCMHMAPSIGGVCEGINVCSGTAYPTCELLFTPLHGIDEVHEVSRPGCVFYGRQNGKIACFQLEATNNTSDCCGHNSSGTTGNVHETTTNTINGNLTGLDKGSAEGTTNHNQTNNVMVWPKGPFTLLQPSTGCPNGWSTGYIQFEMQIGGNSYHLSNYLKGEVADNLVQWYFCTKTSSEGLALWPEGNYCILLHGGYCPSRFWPGIIGFDEEDSGNSADRVRNGTLPDLASLSDVALRFCCRNDGTGGGGGSTEVTLPVSDPFYLFPLYNGPCPVVPGMNYVREFTYFDCEDFANQNFVAGMTPLNVLATNHKIEFCYYDQ